MREVFGAFQSEVFRPLMTILIPGAVGLVGLFAVLIQRCDDFKVFVLARTNQTAFVFLFVALIVGEIFEDLGSRVEYRVFDKTLEKMKKKEAKKTENGNEPLEYPHFTKEWFDYLAQSFGTEPVGHRYMRTLVFRLKFELGMACGTLGLGVGLIGLASGIFGFLDIYQYGPSMRWLCLHG
jgi:hypothetical protein